MAQARPDLTNNTTSGRMADDVDAQHEEARALMRELMKRGVVHGAFEKVNGEDGWTITSAQTTSGDSLDPSQLTDLDVRVKTNSGDREIVALVGSSGQADASSPCLYTTRP